MKVLLYSENLKRIEKSGLGKAIKHQEEALSLNNISYTNNPKDNFDLLHLNTYFINSIRLAKQMNKKNIPVVFHAHSTEEDFRNSFRFSNQISPIFKKWLIHAYKLGTVIITPTPYSKKVLESYDLDREIYPISNGIDLRKFAPIPDARNKFIAKYGYQADDFIVMGIGLYLERKGILDFVELAKRMPHIQFIWFGYTNPNLVPDKICQALSFKLPNLSFPGYVPNSDILLAFQATDLYIFPTLEETEGIPAVEACASKANFIVRDIPVFDEWLIDGVHVYKASNIDVFQNYIERFYANQMTSLVDKAYEVAVERDLPVIGQKLIHVYQRAIEINQKL